jgi:hypothetical protein
MQFCCILYEDVSLAQNLVANPINLGRVGGLRYGVGRRWQVSNSALHRLQLTKST